jgi:hypothetical protein
LLKTLLDALSIPEESQMLVFLSGSLQGQRINTGNPRALYFNDSVSVGWVRGGFIEIASQDPTQGTRDHRHPAGDETRADSCSGLAVEHSVVSRDSPGKPARGSRFATW